MVNAYRLPQRQLLQLCSEDDVEAYFAAHTADYVLSEYNPHMFALLLDYLASEARILFPKRPEHVSVEWDSFASETLFLSRHDAQVLASRLQKHRSLVNEANMSCLLFGYSFEMPDAVSARAMERRGIDFLATLVKLYESENDWTVVFAV